MDHQRVEGLLEKFEKNELNEAEFDELCQLLKSNESEGLVKAKIRQDLERAGFVRVDKRKMDKMLGRILPRQRVYNMFSRTKLVAAAVVLLVFSLGSYFIFKAKQQQPVVSSKLTDKVNTDFPPGRNQAELTLADGTKIKLNDSKDGDIASQGNTKIIKIKGRLSYHSEKATSVEFNTITTPRTGQFQLELADGTRVWLDAASSLRFPTSFSGKERVVELQGQGYFEVAHNTAMPFHVKARGVQIGVLGTHFNIMAYDDESHLKTTLLEGSVSLRTTSFNGTMGKAVMLKPGQQAIISNAIGTSHTGRADIKLIQADVEQAVAWKNGFFNFKSENLQTIMNQIARWYDVEIVFIGKQDVHLSGYISRDINLSETLKLLESNGVHFKREGRKIIMMP